MTREAIGLLVRRALRASDAIHLASCLLLPRELETAVTIVVYDDRLRKAATLEGLPVKP